MMSHKNEVRVAYEEGEGQYVEFKENIDTKKIGETVSAFSNANDGIIIIGVRDRTKDITGIQIGKGTLERIANNIKMNTDPKIFPVWIEPHKFGSGSVIAIKIKENEEKPVFFKTHAFKRVGRTNLKLDSEEIRKLAKEERKHLNFDEQICEGASLEDIDIEKVKSYFERRKERRDITKLEDLNCETLLLNVNAARKLNGEIKPTNTGILCFSKNPERFFPQSRLRLVRFRGDDVTDDSLDQLDSTGSLWEMVEQAESFLRRNLRIVGSRRDSSFGIIQKIEYPTRALREGIINALIHRDYREGADVRVFIFEDRLEILNPGKFPDGTTPENPRHIPVNPTICLRMYEIGYIERYGSGIKMMRRLCRENGLLEPKYEQSARETKLVFYPSKIAILLSEAEKAGLELNLRQKAALEYISEYGSITNREYRAAHDISQKTASIELSELVEYGILIRRGVSRSVRYELK